MFGTPTQRSLILGQKINICELDGGLWPRAAVGVPLPGAAESGEWGEGEVVLWSLQACEHGFLGNGLRPSRVGGVPLAGASPLAARLGRAVERRQGGELRQLALVQFVSVLCERQRDSVSGGGRGAGGDTAVTAHNNQL